MQIYVYDRLILDYLHEHPSFSYDRLSRLLNCSKVFIDERLKLLRKNEYIDVIHNNIRLTEKGEKEKLNYQHLPASNFHTNFEWDTLYIPKDFSLSD